MFSNLLFRLFFQLLPLPKSTAVDPDFSSDQGIRIRGNQEWAPPRPQIIFNTPSKVKLKVAMPKQNNRCAGCGTFVEKGWYYLLSLPRVGAMLHREVASL